jgi:negative modulator of initiation of replication
MKKIEVSEDVYEMLKRLTTDFGQSPNDVLAAILNVGPARRSTEEPLVSYIVGAEFRAKFTDADRYLGILGWVAMKHGSEFKEYIRSLSSGSSGRRYLGLSQEEIVEQCRHNQARQIPNTQFWAIMNIDTATKRRFLARVLEFVGYDDHLIEFVCGVIGARHTGRRMPLPIAPSG